MLRGLFTHWLPRCAPNAARSCSGMVDEKLRAVFRHRGAPLTFFFGFTCGLSVIVESSFVYALYRARLTHCVVTAFPTTGSSNNPT
jgi:hypothetical protein